MEKDDEGRLIWNFEECYKEAKTILKTVYHFTPSLIELVHLRRYVQPVLDDFVKNEQIENKSARDFNWFRPPSEVVCRFLFDHYNIYNPRSSKEGFMFTEEEVGAYISIKQEKFHLL